MPTNQNSLIGRHPTSPVFGIWLSCDDVTVTPTKCHRKLSELVPSNDADLVEWLSKMLIKYHYDDNKIKRLKKKFADIGFPQFAEQNRSLPKADTVQKGNAAEIILTEYIQSTLNKPLIQSFRFRYNANVDQSMKGDDVLLIDSPKTPTNSNVKIYLGESKYRGTPNSQVVTDLSKALEKSKLPLSYSFLMDVLRRDKSTEALADILDELYVKDIKANGNLIYAGLLLSNMNSHSNIETHFSNNNPNLVIISIGINNPGRLITEAYALAESKLSKPTTL
ncbi:unnamed protein product [Rotaria sordida]|uniref:Anti-bacteriophage protein A/HamA C-terminal domain-containing protein n=2 Tax=Rotaria sordida TaxID=392033 RepID=A0A813WW41_9BILA|nr:unnamed protein product [Rotaria sordida]